jgi:hypothetical protein
MAKTIMTTNRIIKIPFIILVFAVNLIANGGDVPATKTHQLSDANDVPEGLAKADWQSIRAAYEAGRHAFMPVEGGWQARNPGQQWTTKFDGRGFIAQPRGADWQWGLELKSFGFAGQERAVGGEASKSVVRAEGQRLTYGWDETVQEWFVNDTRGLEHGFTVRQRPQGSTEAPLQFDLAVRGTLLAQVAADGQGVEFCDASGATVLNYTGLKVWDADGKVLASHFEAKGGTQVRLLVAEKGARYPLTIDPIAQQAYLKASNTGSADYFGASVAVSGDTVVVGAWLEDSSTTGVNSTPNEGAIDSGAAYVFVRSGTTWSQQAYLKASNTGANSYFGTSVAVSGDTVIVGANGENSSTTGVNSTPDEGAATSGAAYVFTRSGATWSQQAYLKASNTGAGDSFGFSVGLSGETAVIGAINEDSSTTGVNGTSDDSAPNSGAAYVFVRSGTTWSQQAYLKASNTWEFDSFGYSVAVSVDSVIVGASEEDSSTTGVNSTPNDSAYSSGAAYVFVRSGTTWSQQAYLKASNSGQQDNFGWAVAVSGDTAVVGAREEGSSTTGVNSAPNNSAPGSGAAYVFVRSGTTWIQQAYLKPGHAGGGGQFGYSVAVSGDTVVVGARFESSSTTGVNSTPSGLTIHAGAAYTFSRFGTTWSQQAYLKASNTVESVLFGASVAVSGDTVIVGALGESSSTTGVNSTPNNNASSAGAAYIFTGFPVPDITVAQAGPVGDGGSVDVGAVLVGSSSAPLTFTISNAGTADLRLGALTKDGTSIEDFSVDTTGMVTTLTPGISTTFTVTFSPTGTGQKTTTLRIASNVSEVENPFDIVLTGKGEVPPTLSAVTIASSNATTALAKLTDTVTLSFTASEAIQTPSVTLLGVAASVANPSGNNWTATATVGAGTVEGQAAFSISAIDLAGNAALAVTATTDASSVTVDRTLPSMTPVTIASNNASPVLARQGNQVVLSFTTSEAIQTPSVTLLGVAATVANPSGNNWTATATVSAGTLEGVATFSISAIDLAGNAAQAATTTTNGSSVVVDKTGPTLTLPSDIDEITNLPTGRPVSFVVSATDAVDPAPSVLATPASGSNFPVGTTTVNATATDVAGNVSQGSFQVMVRLVRPEMTVSGNGQLIAIGDVTPEAVDHTDFGEVPLINTQVRRTFSIGNEGNGVLNLTGTPAVAIGGPGAQDFEVTVVPQSSVPIDGTTTFEVTFDPRLPGQRKATVSIVSNDLVRTPYTFAISGFGALSAPLSQTISFTAPGTFYLGQSSVALNAYATSGLPVMLSVVSGPATIAGNILTLTGSGTVKVQATQAGGGNYKAAAPVMRSLTVKTDPMVLTLVNLNQPYDSLPKPVTTVGTTDSVDITYKVGGVYGYAVPFNAGSYAVKAVAGGVTKNGTLVITKAPLYITPDDKRKFAGQPNPALTLQASGYQGTDMAADVLTKPVVLSTKAKTSSPGGLYPIKSGGGASANYVLIHRPGTLVVESFAGPYEALLVDGTALPVGKLNVTVASSSKSFTGKLFTASAATALSLSGSVTTDTDLEEGTGSASVTKNGVLYDVTFTMPLDGDVSASVTRDATPESSASDGCKLLVLPSATKVTYSGASTAVLEPAIPEADTVPVGAGWAQGTTSTKGVLTLKGKLGDGTAFTTALSPDREADPGYRVFVQPCKPARSGAYLAGAFRQVVSSGAVGSREMRGVAGAPITWVKAGLSSDSSYRTSFGPVTTMMTLDPWLRPAGSDTLAVRLGLTGGTFGVQHSDTGSLSNPKLPSSVALSAKNVVSVLLPQTAPPNITKWKTTINASLGTFTGSFELLDITEKRTVPFSGVLRQPSSGADTLIGDGHFMLPALKTAPSNAKVSGEILFSR